MNESKLAAEPFLLRQSTPDNILGTVSQACLLSLEYLIGLRRCRKLYSEIEQDGPLCEFSRQALEKIGVSYDVADKYLSRIPRQGACILIANHPYGGLDGLVLIDMISRIRPDFKVMGNYLLGRIPEFKAHLIGVDPFDRPQAARTNIAPLRQALKCLRHEELLLVFPAGEVSSWRPRQGCVTDPQWSDSLSGLVRMSRAPVLPIFFPGDNGVLFHLAGTLNARMRTLLLPRMLLNKKGICLHPRIGRPIPAKKLLAAESERRMTDYLRLRTYALGLASDPEQELRPTGARKNPAALIPPVAVADLMADIGRLTAENKLLHSGGLTAYYAEAAAIPSILKEIGRLRELTFRRAGEGTGRACDLDHYDDYYLHLFLWDERKRQLVGAYRIGRVDEILAARGQRGLYSASLFRYRGELLERLKPSLELGRSFVCPDYQRSYAPLLMLWKGISRYLLLHPQYRYLFGPVSISADYSSASRQLMAKTLTRHYRIKELAQLVRGRLPVRLKPTKIRGMKSGQIDPLLENLDDVAMLIADLEDDAKGIPVLLRHYLNLGGKLLAFNLDPEFSNVIDGCC